MQKCKQSMGDLNYRIHSLTTSLRTKQKKLCKTQESKAMFKGQRDGLKDEVTYLRRINKQMAKDHKELSEDLDKQRLLAKEAIDTMELLYQKFTSEFLGFH